MRSVFSALTAGLAVLAVAGWAQQPTTEGPYHIQKTVRVGGEGGFDYIYADAAGRRLYVPRTGPAAHVSVFNLDTLAPAGELPMTNARGVATDARSHHGFASSNPVAMWDTETLKLIKTIPVEGRPDGILSDTYNHHIYVFSHSAPNVTVLNATDGAVLGTMDLGGAPEQAAADGKGHVYVDIEDRDSVAVVDARAMKVTAQSALTAKVAGMRDWRWMRKTMSCSWRAEIRRPWSCSMPTMARSSQIFPSVVAAMALHSIRRRWSASALRVTERLQ